MTGNNTVSYARCARLYRFVFTCVIVPAALLAQPIAGQARYTCCDSNSLCTAVA